MKKGFIVKIPHRAFMLQSLKWIDIRGFVKNPYKKLQYDLIKALEALTHPTSKI